MKKTSGTKTRTIHDPYIESDYAYIEQLGAEGDRTAPFRITRRGPANVPTNCARSKSFADKIDAACKGTAKGR